MQQSLHKQNTISLLLVFLVWPIAGLFYCLQFVKRRFALNYIIAFFSLYGFSLVYNDTMDATRYVFRFQEIKTLDWSEIQSTGLEIYFNVIAFIVSRFTENPRFLFAILGLVYGFFFMQMIKILLSQISSKQNNIFVNYFFIAVVLYIPFSSLIGVRSHTAMFIFLYSCLLIVTSKQRDWRHLLIAILTITVHWSYIIPLIFLFIFFIDRHAFFKVNVLLLFSFILRFTSTLDFSGLIHFFGGDIEQRYNAYNTESYIDSRIEAMTMVKSYVTERGDYMFVFLLAVLFIHFLFRKNLRKSITSQRMYILFALMISMFNFVSNNIITYERFQQVTNIVGLIYVFFFIKDCATIKIKQIVFLLSLIPFTINLWVNLRLDLDSINAFLILGNGLFIWITDFNESILSLLGVT